MKTLALILILNLVTAASFAQTTTTVDGRGVVETDDTISDQKAFALAKVLAVEDGEKKCAPGIATIIPSSVREYKRCPGGQFGCDGEHELAIVTAQFSCLKQTSALTASVAVTGKQAEQIYQLLQSVGHTEGLLSIWGYVTEKANPVINYDTAILITNAGERLQLDPGVVSLFDVQATLEQAGAERVHHGGGTVYIQYKAQVLCESKDLCHIGK